MRSKKEVQQEIYFSKIQSLSEKGYKLIGDVPTYTTFSPEQSRWGAFLFFRNGNYYQYQIAAFFSEKPPELDDFNEPRPSSKPNNIMTNPFVKVTGSSNPDENLGFIYTAIQESNLDLYQPPANIFFIKYNASLTFHAKLAGAGYKLPPIININTSYAQLDKVDFAKELQKNKCYPKAAYILLNDSLVYVKDVGKDLCWEQLQFKTEVSIDLVNTYFNKNATPTENKESIQEVLESNISLRTLEFIRESTLNHNLIMHKVIGGEMYFKAEVEEKNIVEDSLELINNKSGSHSSSDAEAITILGKFFKSQTIKKAYVKGLIEDEEVKAELSLRLKSSPNSNISVANTAKEDSADTNTSLPSFFITTTEDTSSSSNSSNFLNSPSSLSSLSSITLSSSSTSVNPNCFFDRESEVNPLKITNTNSSQASKNFF